MKSRWSRSACTRSSSPASAISPPASSPEWVGGVGEGRSGVPCRSGEGRSGEGRSGEGHRSAQRLARLIRREGPVRFDTFVEEALYGEGGFFASGTAVRAAASEGHRRRLHHEPRGRPDLRRAGGRGARSLVGRARATRSVPRGRGRGAGRAACARCDAGRPGVCALRYMLVERSGVKRRAARALLRLEPSMRPSDRTSHGPEAP